MLLLSHRLVLLLLISLTICLININNIIRKCTIVIMQIWLCTFITICTLHIIVCHCQYIMCFTIVIQFSLIAVPTALILVLLRSLCRCKICCTHDYLVILYIIPFNRTSVYNMVVLWLVWAIIMISKLYYICYHFIIMFIISLAIFRFMFSYLLLLTVWWLFFSLYTVNSLTKCCDSFLQVH